MPQNKSYTLSNAADNDLSEIYRYSLHTFGEQKADAYLLALDEILHLLAASPRLGRSIESIHKNCLCYPHARHAIYYQPSEKGIFVLRVLHQREDEKIVR